MPRRAEDTHKARSPQALLRDRVREFARPLPVALSGQEEAVHDLRIAARRLRVAVRILSRKPDGKRSRRAIADLERVTRLAGMSRDLDVAVSIEEEREASQPDRRLRASLRASRARARVRMANALLDSDLAGLRRTLRRLLSRGAVDRSEALRRIFAMASEAGAVIAAGFAQTGERFDAEALHALRRDCRRLRYASELACAVAGRSSEAPTLFKRIQELIGALHDRHVLSVLLSERASAALRRGHGALAAAAEVEARWAAESAREHHQRLLAKAPAALAARAVSALLRLTEQAAAPAHDSPGRPLKRTRNPSSSGEPR